MEVASEPAGEWHEEPGHGSGGAGAPPERAWRFAHASVVGSSHLRNGTPCQDASACEYVAEAGGAALVAVVSDGAGSAPYSQFASQLPSSRTQSSPSAWAPPPLKRRLSAPTGSEMLLAPSPLKSRMARPASVSATGSESATT